MRARGKSLTFEEEELDRNTARQCLRQSQWKPSQQAACSATADPVALDRRFAPVGLGVSWAT